MDFAALVVVIAQLVAGSCVVILIRLLPAPGLELRGVAFLASYFVGLNGLLFLFIIAAMLVPALQSSDAYGLFIIALTSVLFIAIQAASIPFLHRFLLPLGGRSLSRKALRWVIVETILFSLASLVALARFLRYIGRDLSEEGLRLLLREIPPAYTILQVLSALILLASWVYPLSIGLRHALAARRVAPGDGPPAGFLTLPVLLVACTVPPALVLDAAGFLDFSFGNASVALFLVAALLRVYILLRREISARSFPAGASPPGTTALPAAELRDEVALRLAAREREIALLLLRGMANKDIARELGISYSTTKNYIFSLFRKLGINSRFEVLRFAKGAE